MDIPGPLDALEQRIRTLLPDLYQDCYESVEPVSMGSAGLKYGRDGQVAWNDIWGSFCDLAMAGGPPHKGTLLTPASPEAIAADPEAYTRVTHELCRGIQMVSYNKAAPSPYPGWVAVSCDDPTEAGWLLRAIVMENVSAFQEGPTLLLPAGPAYRVEKEIKNVITAIAKTSHYWLDHTPAAQRRHIAALFAEMEAAAPLLTPPPPAQPSAGPAWRGLEFPDVAAAIWTMRALVASNILARREGAVLYVPVNPAADPGGARLNAVLAQLSAYAPR